MPRKVPKLRSSALFAKAGLGEQIEALTGKRVTALEGLGEDGARESEFSSSFTCPNCSTFRLALDVEDQVRKLPDGPEAQAGNIQLVRIAGEPLAGCAPIREGRLLRQERRGPQGDDTMS